jgi:hypothetical protein
MRPFTAALIYRRAAGDGWASGFGLAVLERSGVSRPARAPLDLNVEPMR